MSALALLLLFTACGDAGDAKESGAIDTNSTTDSYKPPDPEALFVAVGDGLSAALVSVWGSSATDVWVGGARDVAGALVYHYDGTSWTRLDTTGLNWDVWWLWGDGAGTLFMAGSQGNVARVDIATSTITTEVLGDAAYTYFGTWGTSANDVWAVGGDILGDLPGAIYHFDGVAWSLAANASTRSDGVSQRDAFKVWGRSATDVFVVGTGSLTMHWDGSAWSDIDSPIDESVTLFTVAGDGASAIAVGGASNGQAQTMTDTTAALASPTPDQIAPGFLGVYDREGMDPVASGNNGSIWWYRTGVWAKDTRASATFRGLHAVWVDPGGGLWAVGGDLNALTDGVVVYAGADSVPVIE